MSPFKSSAQRVFDSPELLRTIFSFMEKKENARSALVCKLWSEPALDTVWHDFDDLYYLFCLLAPMRLEIEGLVFASTPTSAGWLRFLFYSKRIRKLTYCVKTTTKVLKKTAFDDVARTRSSLNILPNLNTLHWDAPLPLSVLFMHTSVKHFIVFLSWKTTENLELYTFFDDVVVRTPTLQILDIRSNVGVGFMQSGIVQMLGKLTKLQKLRTPRFYFTTALAECLSRLPVLGVIEYQYGDEQGIGVADDTSDFKPALTEGAFPSLWDLSFSVYYDDASRFLSIPFAPTNLSILFIESDKVETALDIATLLNIIASSCQLLRELTLISLRDPTVPMLDRDDFFITLETLRPMLSCSSLTSMDFLHQYPVRLSQDDVETIASSWPSLERLVLSNEPVHMNESDLTLVALLPFAKYCPKLVYLGLFIDATDMSLIPPPDPVLGYPMFQSLDTLAMGVSIICDYDPDPVALFLSQLITSVACDISNGLTYGTLEILQPNQEHTNMIQHRCDRWDRVDEVLPTLIRARVQERERNKLMRKEVEDLRMRLGISSDRDKAADGLISL